MGLSSTVSDVTYAGNNSTVTPYAVPFRFDDNSWLRVRVTTSAGLVTNLALGSGFTITGSGVASSASVRTVAAVANTSTVYIYRDTPKTNTFQPTLSGGVQAVPLEAEADKLTMIAQDNARESGAISGRALRVPFGETVPDLPSAANRASKTLGFDGSGNPLLVSTGLITDVAAVAAAAASADADAASAAVSAGLAAGYAAQLQPPLIVNDHRVNWFVKQVLAYANAAPIDRKGKYIGICSVGDSISTFYQGAFSAELVKRFGIGAYASSTFNGQYGFPFSNGNNTNNQADLAGGTTRVSNDLRYLGNGEYWNLPIGGTVTETQTQHRHRCGFRRMVFFYGKQPGAGTLTIQVKQQGSVTATKVVSTAGTANDIGMVEILPADGLLDNLVPTIVVTGSVAASHYIGGYVFLREGVVPGSMSFPGTSLAQGANIPIGNITLYLQTLGISLLYHAFKEQTPSTPSSLSGADMIAHFNKYAANFPNYTQLLIGQTPSDLNPPGSDQSLTAIMRQCALDHNFPFVDTYKMFGSFQEVTDLNWVGGDSIHLVLQVYQVVASKIFSAIFNGFDFAGGMFVSVNRRDYDQRFIQNTAYPIPFSFGSLNGQTGGSNFVFRQGDPANDSGRDLTKRWFFSGNPPTANSQCYCILGYQTAIFGRNRFRASWNLGASNITSGIAFWMLFGQDGNLTNGLTKQGVAVEHGFESISGTATHYVRMHHHDGTNLYSSAKFYLENAGADAGLWGYQGSGDYVLDFDGNGGLTPKRMTLYFRAPTLFSGQPGTVQPFKIADWDFTVSNGNSTATSDPQVIARVEVGSSPVVPNAFAQYSLSRVSVDYGTDLTDLYAVPY